MYFFQDAPGHACRWAAYLASIRKETPVVAEAVIDIGGAVDFCDLLYWNLLKETISSVGLPPKDQLGPEALFRTLNDNEQSALYYNYEDDWYVTNMIARLELRARVPVIRAPFVEGKPLHARSWLFDQAHVQTCVRYPHAIKRIRWFEVKNDRLGSTL